jgi:hypothetical protein
MSGIGPVGTGEEFPDMNPKPCWEAELQGIHREQLASDSVGVPVPEHARFASHLWGTTKTTAEDDRLWLPAGTHAGLQIEHDHRVETGPFVEGDWGWCWHITVSHWNSVDAMREVLHSKHAEVQFVIGGRTSVDLPVLIQCLPLNQFGKGLVHFSGQPETNRKRLIQVEVCATPDEIGTFSHYRALANLFWLCTHGNNPRVPVVNRLAREFDNDKRFTSTGYKRVKGHHGHRHVPQNNHDDPTRKFNGGTLVKLCEDAPHELG